MARVHLLDFTTRAIWATRSEGSLRCGFNARALWRAWVLRTIALFLRFHVAAHARGRRMIAAEKSPNPSDPQRLVREWPQASSVGARNCASAPHAKSSRIHRRVGELDAALLRSKRPSPKKERCAHREAHNSLVGSKTQSV